jgi:glutathione peroxidase-family protein
MEFDEDKIIDVIEWNFNPFLVGRHEKPALRMGGGQYEKQSK